MKTETYPVWKPEEYTYEHAFGFIPNITSYLHENDQRRPCILVVPGGGYGIVSPTEGELVALEFYERGYQTFILSYTIDMLRMVPLRLRPLKDISRAVRYIRKNADAFQVDGDKLVVCGFSAGGHLCGSLCVHHQDISDENPDYSEISNCPNAAILGYPVISSGEKAHRDSFVSLFGPNPSSKELEYMSLEKQVTEQTPPCFVWVTATDELVPMENSEMFARACREKGVTCALHVFSKGPHSMSLANEEWSKGLNMSDYMMDQGFRVLKKVKEGVIPLPQEVIDELERVGKTFIQETLGTPNPEVAIWPDLAETFLAGLNLNY